MQDVYLNMRNPVLAFCFILFLFRHSHAQLTITPDYLLMPSAFNPASLGINNEEAISMSILSTSSSNFISSSTPNLNTLLDSRPYFFNIPNPISLTTNVKNLYFIGYHNTIRKNEKMNFTLGGQIQMRKDYVLRQTTPQTFGMTANAHFLLKPKRNKVRYFSNGIQVMYHHFAANKAMADYLQSEIFEENIYTYKGVKKLLNHHGYSLSYNANFHSHRADDRACSFGVSIATTSEKLLSNSLDNIPDNLGTINVNHFSINTFMNFQKVVNDSFLLEFAASTGGRYLSYYIGSGFRIKENAVIRLYAGITADYNDAVFSFRMNLETRKYNLSAIFGNSVENDATVLQISTSYNLGSDVAPSLLRLH